MLPEEALRAEKLLFSSLLMASIFCSPFLLRKVIDFTVNSERSADQGEDDQEGERGEIARFDGIHGIPFSKSGGEEGYCGEEKETGEETGKEGKAQGAGAVSLKAEPDQEHSSDQTAYKHCGKEKKEKASEREVESGDQEEDSISFSQCGAAEMAQKEEKKSGQKGKREKKEGEGSSLFRGEEGKQEGDEPRRQKKPEDPSGNPFFSKVRESGDGKKEEKAAEGGGEI